MLIVADSFDAMTSARAYRPPLTMAEAVQELRDKAGTQSPAGRARLLVHDRGSSAAGPMGPSQLAALRAEFSRIPTLRLRRISALFSPAMLTVCTAAVTLAAIGIPDVSMRVTAGIGALTLALAGITLTESISTRRRRRWARAALADGRSAEAALEAAGVVGWAVWLTWMADAERYEAAHAGRCRCGRRRRHLPPCAANRVHRRVRGARQRRPFRDHARRRRGHASARLPLARPAVAV